MRSIAFQRVLGRLSRPSQLFTTATPKQPKPENEDTVGEMHRASVLPSRDQSIAIPLPFLLLAVVTLTLGGCSTPILYSIPATNARIDKGGVSYYLPKKLLKVAVVRQLAPTADEVKKAKAELDAAEKAVEAAKQAVKTEEAILNKLPKDDEAKPTREARLKKVLEARAILLNVQKAHDDANIDYQEKKVAADAAAAGKVAFLDRFTLTPLPAVPDTEHRYIAQSKHVATRRDLFNLKTTTSGLLTNSAAVAEDKSGEVISQIAGLVFAFIGGPSPVSSTPQLVERIEPSCPGRPEDFRPAPFSIELVVDPMDLKEAVGTTKSHVDQTLCALGADYVIRRKPVGIEPDQIPHRISCEGAKDQLTDCPGLFYRRDLPHILSVQKKVGREFIAVSEISMPMPNASPVEFLSLEGAAFVTRAFTTVFDNGMLIRAR